MAVLASIWLCDADDAPPEVEYTRALHDALFVGELIGVEVAAARQVLASIDRGRRLSAEESRALAAVYGEVRRRLADAIDGDGRAVAGRADPLLASDVVAADEHGVLYLRGGRHDLIDLVHTLGALGDLFDAARVRGLPIEVRYS